MKINLLSIRQCLLENEDNHNCSGKISDAHSVQKSFVLKEISEKGHVYSLLKNQLQGINKASTFPGFCSYHDTTVFRPIDFKKDIRVQRFSDEQVCLFHFRALAKEYCAKRDAIKTFHNIESKNDVIDLGIPIKGQTQGLRDMEKDLRDCIDQLTSKKYKLIKCFHFIISSKPMFVTNIYTSPVVDFNDEKMNDFYGEVGSIFLLGINIFPNFDKYYVLITWHKRHHKKAIYMINQLKKMNNHDKKIMLSKFILAHAENIFFRPSFINEQTTDWNNNMRKIYVETGGSSFKLNRFPDIDIFG